MQGKEGGNFGLKDDLRALREGTLDPTERLVKAFKDFVGPTILESEIDSQLVTPFSVDTQ